MYGQDPKTKMDDLRTEIGQVRGKLPFETRFFDVDKVLLEARILTAKHKAALEQMDETMGHVISLVVQDQVARALMRHELELDEDTKARAVAVVGSAGMRAGIAIMLGLPHLAYPEGMTDEQRVEASAKHLDYLRSEVYRLEEEAHVKPVQGKPKILSQLSKETLTTALWNLSALTGVRLEAGSYEVAEGKEQQCLDAVWDASRRAETIAGLAEGDVLDLSEPENEEDGDIEEKEDA